MTSARLFLIVIIVFVFDNCRKPQEARRPVSYTKNDFIKESIERNKKLYATEEQKIDSTIKSQTKSKFISSKKGFWYSYEIENKKDTLRPQKGDIAFFDYEIKDLDGNIIYAKEELSPKKYHIDKEQEIISGLRNGIKLMRKGEKINFLFPSHLAYGYRGDAQKIGANQPIICTVTLTNFSSEKTIKNNKK